MSGVSLAAWQRIEPLLPKPRAIAGYSVGELPAFCAAGVFTVESALWLAERRAALMDACVFGVDSGLKSVNGLTLAQTETLCGQHGLQIAIHIGADTCIVGGRSSHLDVAAAAALRAGAHGSRLAASAQRAGANCSSRRSRLRR